MRSIRTIRTSLFWLVMLGGACGNSNDANSNGADSGGAGGTGIGGAGGSVPNAGGMTTADGGIGATGTPAGTGVSGGGPSASGGAGNGGASEFGAIGGATISGATGGATSAGTSGGMSGGGTSSSIATGGATSVGTSGGASSGGASNSSATGGVTSVGTSGGTSSGGASNSSATGGTLAGGASCGPRGGVGNSGGFGDELPPIPMQCATTAQCSSGICYDGPAAQTMSCRQSCDTATVGQQGSCAVGQICVYASSGQSAACLDPCTPFQEPGTCQAGQWCYPAPNTSFTGGVAVAGLCVAAGDYPEGSRCPSGGCGVGLLCVAPALNGYDTYHCEPACNSGAAPDQAGACGAGETCLEDVQKRGACALQCDPFSKMSQCPTGEWCYPFHERKSTNWGIQGRCVRTGKHPAGASCTLGECGEGLKCVADPEPALGNLATCRPICDPHAANSCQAGETCIPDRISGTALEVGTCQKSCKLWQSDPCKAGCASDEWCAPTYLDQDFGRCESATAQASGATCGITKTCAAGNVCLCRFEDTCLSDGRCERTCSLSATGSDPGSCPASEVCAPELTQGGWSVFGTCHGSCDYDAGVACADSMETCVPGELLPHGKDTCLDVPQHGACSALTQPGASCGSTALCLEDVALTSCKSVCRSSKGALGTNNHPDCPKPSSICTEISPGLAYGTCS